MVWQVRLLLGIRSLARAGPSCFVHPRRRCMACTIPVPQGRNNSANAGRTTGRAAHRISGGQVGCSNHPALPKGARSSVNCPAKSRRRDDGKALGECAGDYRGRIAPCSWNACGEIDLRQCSSRRRCEEKQLNKKDCRRRKDNDSGNERTGFDRCRHEPG